MSSLLEIDHLIFHYINVVWYNSFFDIFFPFITDLHKTIAFKVIIFPLFIGLFYWKFRVRGLYLFLGLLLCLGFSDWFGSQIIKKNVQRPRPVNTIGVEVIERTSSGGYSFTSNHASNMFAMATYTSTFLPILKVPLFVLAALVAYSRVYNGAHFPLDVLVGGLLGLLWGLLFSWAVRKISLRRPRP